MANLNDIEHKTMTLQIPLQKKSFTIDCIAELMVSQLQPGQCIMTSQTLFEGEDAYHNMQIMDKKDLLKVMVSDPPHYNRAGVHLDSKGNTEDRLSSQRIRFEKFGDKAGYTNMTIYGVSNEEFVKILNEQKPSRKQIQILTDEEMDAVGWDETEAIQIQDCKVWEWMNTKATPQEKKLMDTYFHYQEPSGFVDCMEKQNPELLQRILKECKA